MGKRLVVIEHANPTVFDVGAQGDTVGDVRVFSNDLYDEANASVVGTDQGMCVRTAVGKRFECTWTNIFDNGTIVTQGPGLDAAFGGAEIGELMIKKLEDQDHQFAFTFALA